MKRSLVNNLFIFIIIVLFSVFFFRRSSREGFAASNMILNYAPTFDWGPPSYTNTEKPANGFIGVCPIGYKTYILSNLKTGSTNLNYYICALKASITKEIPANSAITDDLTSSIRVNDQPFNLSRPKNCGKASTIYKPSNFQLIETKDTPYIPFKPAKTVGVSPAQRVPKENGTSLVGFLCNKI